MPNVSFFLCYWASLLPPWQNLDQKAASLVESEELPSEGLQRRVKRREWWRYRGFFYQLPSLKTVENCPGVSLYHHTHMSNKASTYCSLLFVAGAARRTPGPSQGSFCWWCESFKKCAQVPFPWAEKSTAETSLLRNPEILRIYRNSVVPQTSGNKT